MAAEPCGTPISTVHARSPENENAEGEAEVPFVARYISVRLFVDQPAASNVKPAGD